LTDNIAPNPEKNQAYKKEYTYEHMYSAQNNDIDHSENISLYKKTKIKQRYKSSTIY
jgi:hypothetical protein